MAQYRSAYAETTNIGRHRAETRWDRIMSYFRSLFAVEIINR